MAETSAPKSTTKPPSPYPIAVDLKPETEGAAALKGAIVQLAEQGLMAEVVDGNLHVGDRLLASFELPVLEAPVVEPVRIVKLYTKADPRVEAASRIVIAEMHFARPQVKTVKGVEMFLRKAKRNML